MAALGIRLLVREATALGLAMTMAATALVVVLGPSAGAQDAPTEASDPDALLERIASAEGATYQARQLVVYFDEPQSAAVMDVRSAPDGTFVRAESSSGADVTRIWRRAGHGLVASDELAIEDLAPPGVSLDAREVREKYDIGVGSTTMQLGVEVIPLDLVRRSDRRHVERLWVDPRSGVVYRRELFGAEGSLLGLSQMLEMHWGERGEAEERTAAMPTEKVRKAPTDDAPGELHYGYELAGGYRFSVDETPTDHWVYTDGLHTLSVFRTEGSMERPERYRAVELDDGTAWAGPGPGTWTWEGDGFSWVVVAEEPQLDPEEIVRPFPMGGRSIWARLGAWWTKAWQGIVGLFD